MQSVGLKKIYLRSKIGSVGIKKKSISVGDSLGRELSPMDVFSMSYYVHARLKLISVTFYKSWITFWGIPLILILNFSKIQLNF